MRYVVMHRAGPDDGAGVPPPPQELQQRSGEAGQEPDADASRGAR